MQSLIERVESQNPPDELEEWDKATHYMNVKNPKTGNMNKIGFNDAGRAVSGDQEIIQSINFKRKQQVQGARRAVNAPKQHNAYARQQDATGSSGTNRDYKAAATKRDLADAEKSRMKSGADRGRRSDSELDRFKDGQRVARSVERGYGDAVDALKARKAKLSATHGAEKGKGALGRLARKVKTFFKPKTLGDKDI
jgi:hypothetical protein